MPKTKTVSEGQLLLNAILNNPREDTPRLVYADWLEENAKGQPDLDRAEFIRLGVALYSCVDEKVRKEMSDRIKKLFDTNVPSETPARLLWPEYSVVLSLNPRAGSIVEGVQIDGVRVAYRGGGIRIRRGFPYWLTTNANRYVPISKTLFSNFPITVIHLWDLEPSGGVEGSVNWVRGGGEEPPNVPPCIFDLLGGDYQHYPSQYEPAFEARMPAFREYFSGDKEAMDELMVAAIRYGRKRAGLPYGVRDCHLYC